MVESRDWPLLMPQSQALNGFGEAWVRVIAAQAGIKVFTSQSDDNGIDGQFIPLKAGAGSRRCIDDPVISLSYQIKTTVRHRFLKENITAYDLEEKTIDDIKQLNTPTSVRPLAIILITTERSPDNWVRLESDHAKLIRQAYIKIPNGSFSGKTMHFSSADRFTPQRLSLLIGCVRKGTWTNV